MKEHIKKLNILVGLPGAGKSHFVKGVPGIDVCNLGATKIRNINFDSIEKGIYHKRSKNDVLSLVAQYLRNCEEAYCDGLFLSQESLFEFLDFVFKVIHLTVDEIIIHYWTPKKDVCLYNKEYLNSATESRINLINDTILEIPDVKAIEKKYHTSTKLIYHTTLRKPAYKYFAAEEGLILHDEKYLCSKKWCTGGTSRNYEGDEWGIEGDEPVNEFKELDDLLENVCPNISYLKYKKILNECVSLKRSSESDYYSSTEYLCHACDIEKLYNLLQGFEEYEIEIPDCQVEIKPSENGFIGQIIVKGNSIVEVKQNIINLLGKDF